MALLRCHVLDKTGQLRTRWFLAKRHADPTDICHHRGFILIRTLPIFRQGLSLDQRQSLYRELGSMLNAGVSLTESLHLLGQQQGHVGALCRTWRDATASGQALSQCMAAHQETAHPMALTMTRVGENSGQLGESLHFCAQYFARMAILRQKLLSSLLYPALVLFVSAVALIILTFYVLPRFAQMFTRFDMSLPTLTQWLLGATACLSRYGWLFFLALLLLVSWSHRAQWQQHPRMFALRNRLPIAGPIIRDAQRSVLCQALAILLKADVRIHEALGLLIHLFADPNMHSRLQQTHRRVIHGDTLAAAFAASELLPEIDRKQLAIGESTGTLCEQMVHLAERHQVSLEKRAARLLALFEPMLILGIGLFIGLVLTGLYLPLFELLGGAGIRK